MNTEQQQISISKQEAHDAVELGMALDRLHQNPDFKKIVLDGYFREEPIRLVPLKAQHLSEAVTKGVENAMIGIGAIQSYFNKIYRDGDSASQALGELSEMEQEVNSEV